MNRNYRLLSLRKALKLVSCDIYCSSGSKLGLKFNIFCRKFELKYDINDILSVRNLN